MPATDAKRVAWSEEADRLLRAAREHAAELGVVLPEQLAPTLRILMAVAAEAPVSAWERARKARPW